jgi:hypothetical protein
MLSASAKGAAQLGWNKALDAHDHPDPTVRTREHEDLSWWVTQARACLDHHTL